MFFCGVGQGRVFLVFDAWASNCELQQPHMVPPLSWHMPVRPWLVRFCRLLQKLIRTTVASKREKVILRVIRKVVIRQ
jgi:hypothetical protein